MPFCTNCSQEIQADWKICPFCGNPNVLSQRDENKEVVSIGTRLNDIDGRYGSTADSSQGTIDSRGASYGVALNKLPDGHVLENRYRIQQKLGRGGFGTVYKAWDNNTECWKALKVIDVSFYDDKRVIADLKRETQLLMKLNSPYIVRVWDVHLNGEIKFIDMEYIEGGDLEDLLLSYPDHKVPEEKVMELLNSISLGMIDIHKHNIIHKDLKPQNIMLTKSGNIKIMDFGISETFRSSKSRKKETSKSGTPAYMSPEQLLGKNVGKEADIWSVGVMIHELLFGQNFYTGQSSSDVLMQIEKKEFEPISGVSTKINSLIKKCLKYNYQERFRNFEKITEYLSKDFEKEKISEQKHEEIKSQRSRSKKSLIGIIVAIIIFTSFSIFQKKALVEKELYKQQQKISENMILVKGGTYYMGSSNGDIDEKPIHSVDVSEFYIGKYEVVQEEWKAIMGNNPSSFKTDIRPVESVSWNDIQEFLTKLNLNTGLNYRLASEAEWEYAARGGSKSKGYKYSGSNIINDVAWTFNILRIFNGKTQPVGLKQPNELGIYDMSGNVSEWCSDWKESYSNGSNTNSRGPRVIRGGSWAGVATCSRVAYRSSDYPDNSSEYVGFRLVRNSHR